MKPLILASFFLLSNFLVAQIDSLNKEDLDSIAHIKANLFKEIALSKEFQNTVQCKIVVIPNLSIGPKKKKGSFYSRPYRQKDSLTVYRLRDILPSNYWVYQVDNDLEYMNQAGDLIEYYTKEYPVYTSNKISENMEGRKNPFTNELSFFYDYCNGNFDIIKIYEPFDKWESIYSYKLNRYDGYVEVVIPVKNEHLERLNSKENYMLFKLKIYVEDNHIISKEVISD